MEKYLRPLISVGTANTLDLFCDAEVGIIEIRGRVINSEGLTFYEPLLKWIKDFANLAVKQTSVIIKLEYFNTSASVRLLHIFKSLEVLNRRSNQVTIYWYFEEGDKEMIECGEDYAKIIQIPFKFISYND